MTMQMILSLGILVIMIVMIMCDKFPFGAPPIFACILLVVTGLSTVDKAFAGFVNPNVIMIAGFMVVMAGLMKTNLIEKIQHAIISLVNKGGYRSYILLLIVVMLGASLVGTGSTGYYVLILAMVAAIPYNKKLPASKLMMPLGFATNHPLIPFNVALLYGVTVSVLKTSGYDSTLPMAKFAMVNLFLSAGFLIWSLIGYKVLPDHELTDEHSKKNKKVEEEIVKEKLPVWKERTTIIVFIISVIGMMFMDKLGETAYVLPAIAGAVLLFIGVLDFDEVRDNMVAPVIIMTAGVIGVADALASSGFTALIGDAVANTLGTNISPFLFILICALLTSTCAAFTGSNMGSVFIFAPIAIAASVSLGMNPAAAATAVVISGWNGGYMPIDGMPAMIMGMGKYKMKQFWAFSVPMYFFRIVFLCIGAFIMFPA